MEILNLVEILKDCPKGTKLYSPALGECALEGVIDSNDYPIKVKYKIINNDTRVDYFTRDGYILLNKPDAECMLFPSKNQRDWNKWHKPFVDGDVVYAEVYDLPYIIIYHKQIDERVYCHACLCLETGMFDCDKDCIFTDDTIDEWRLATEEEKQKLFDVIKDKGYRWNDENKTLEKLIEPKFKVGDSVQSKTDNNDKFTITNIDNNKFYYGHGNNHEFMIPVIKQDNWELVPNKFDITTLKPFDKVLVRFNDAFVWGISHFSHINNDFGIRFICENNASYIQCVPYNDETKYLLGTAKYAPANYINW